MLNAYPRPAFARPQWTNLNGAWRFAFDDGNQGLKQKWFEDFPQGLSIQVPYTYETRMSGIGEEAFHPVVWYERLVDIPPVSGRLLLHFEGVDYEAAVYLNGTYAGGHQGGYAAFSLDITPFVQPGQNKITVRVQDSDSVMLPRGKQRWKKENFGCWYVQTTGIWKTVWLETVPDCYLDHVKITPDIDTGTVHMVAKLAGDAPADGLRLVCEVSFRGNRVARQEMAVPGDQLAFSLQLSGHNPPWDLQLWHPDHPHLYDVTFSLVDDGGVRDSVSSYVGMRKIEVAGDQVLLNNLPIYQRLILDQGYWPDSHMTPPDDRAYEKDLDLILAAGYNGLRKHQKTEDRRFLYLCDKKGLLVWSEMAAQYTFNDQAMALFTREWLEVVAQNYNHPSVIVWTPFNESWGIGEVFTNRAQQDFTRAVYHLTKAYDGMRPVIVNDGWEHTVSDILTLHDYEEDAGRFAARYRDLPALLNNQAPYNLHKYAMARGFAYQGQPVIISEYGGIAMQDESGWGYGNQVADEAAFLKRFEAITGAIQAIPGIVGFCYTQVSDVQQEVNGLFTPERQPKVDLQALREVNTKRTEGSTR